MPLALGSDGKKKKLAVAGFLMAIGDTLTIDYIVGEDGHCYNYSVTLASGDAFAVNTDVRELSFSISEIKAGTKPKELLLRDGALLITVEKD